MNDGSRGTPKPYVVVVATVEPRKNLHALIEAYCLGNFREDFDLVVVGRRGWGPNTPPVAGCHFTGDVTDTELMALYQGARALVSPSLYEGFGLPLVEAMLAGLPVFCSDLPVYREVTGGRARYFDPSLTDALIDALREAGEATEAAPEAEEWAKRFTWRRAACEMERILSREDDW